MAETPAGTQPEKPDTNRGRAPRSTMPYYIAAFVAAAAMAWYFFLFVPANLDYFTGVRLRTLAVASSLVRNKAENLASALERAPRCTGENDTDRYLRILVPEIQLTKPDEIEPPGVRLLVSRPPDCGTARGSSGAPQRSARGPAPGRARVGAASAAKGTDASASGTAPAQLRGTVTWDDLMAQAADVSRADFDDLVLALADGEVVWQREETAPRLGNLAQVLYADVAEEGWFSFSWWKRRPLPKLEAKQLPTAVAAKAVSLGGESSLLLVQAVPLWREGIELDVPAPPAGAAQKTRPVVFVAGLVSRAALQRQATHVPVAWVVLLSLPFILLFLALPFVKLATLTPRERFGFVDAAALLIATIVTVALAATIPFVATIGDEDTDDALAKLAVEIEARLVDDVVQVLGFGRTLTTRYPELTREPAAQTPDAQKGAIGAPASVAGLQPCDVAVNDRWRKRCNLWAAVDPAGTVKPGAIDLDVVVWVDETGTQRDKWTTKSQITGEASHRPLQHFRDLTLERLWRLRLPRPPAAGVRPAIHDKQRFTIEPLRAPTTGELGVIVGTPLNGGPEGARYLLLNLRPRSLLDAIVAPEYGFAVIAPDGRVMFHSEESRSLHENFFEEVGEPADVQARVQSGHAVTWNGTYHGRQHRLHLQQLHSFEASPWRIVTFRQLGPTLADVVAHQRGTLRLAVLNLLVLVLLAAIVLWRAKTKGRNPRDLLNVQEVTRPRRLIALVALGVVGTAAVLLTYASFTRQWMNAWYVLFVLLPVLALAASAWARRGKAAGTAEPAAFTRALVACELGLLVLLVAALPAAGFARIVDRIEGTNRAVRWLEDTQRRVAARNERVLTRLNGPAYRGARAIVAGWGHTDTETFKRTTYVTFLPERVEIAPSCSDHGDPADGQGLVRFLLYWNPFPSRDAAGQPPVRRSDDGFCMEPLSEGSPVLRVRDPALKWPSSFEEATDYSLPPAKLVFAVLLLAGTIAALYWARRRLLTHPPVDAPTIDKVLECIPEDGNHGVMLIGPPRTHKDRAVKQALAQLKAVPHVRIWLLDNVADDAFIETHLQRFDPPPDQPAPASPVRLWLHISNLETHLVDVDARKRALRLLERALEADPARQSRVVLVTVNVDPVAHFEEIFDEERRGIYDDAIPEVELARFSLLLTQFHRCYVPFVADDGHDPWWNYDPKNWKSVLEWETRAAPLEHVRDELTALWKDRTVPVTIDELARAVGTRAYALYQLLWTSCTRREKLVLVQLAQEGFVTPQSADAVSALMAKGLIVRRPGPAIFNYTFRVFLRRIERSEVVREWEEGEGHGVWVVAGRLVASSVVAGGLFFLITQGYSVQGLLPVVSGTGVFGVPLVRSLVARFGDRAGAGAAA